MTLFLHYGVPPANTTTGRQALEDQCIRREVQSSAVVNFGTLMAQQQAASSTESGYAASNETHRREGLTAISPLRVGTEKVFFHDGLVLVRTVGEIFDSMPSKRVDLTGSSTFIPPRPPPSIRGFKFTGISLDKGSHLCIGFG